MFKKDYDKNLAFLGPYKKFAVVMLLVMIITAFFEAISLSVLIPFTQVVLDTKTTEGVNKAVLLFNENLLKYVSEKNRILAICAVLMSIFIIKNILVYLTKIMEEYLKNSIRKYSSYSILNKYIHAEYDYIISEKRGALINNLINEPWIASKLIGKAVAILSNFFIAMCIYIMFLIVNWQVTLVLTGIIGVFFGLFWKMSKKVADHAGNERLRLLQELTAEGEQSLNAIRQVKLFNIEKIILKDYDNKYTVFRDLLVKFSLYHSIPQPFGEIFVVSGFVITLLYFRYIGHVSINAMLPIMVFVIMAAGSLYQKVGVLVQNRLWLQAYVPSVKLINNILTSDEIKKEKFPNAVKIKHLPGDIVFKDVSFAHSGSKSLFNDLNICIPKNKITAIVGKSGSGKSTLVDLLCGLYKGYEGKIMVGNYDLKELKLSSWRKMIGFVSQDTFLFSTTVKNNILIGNSDATEADIIAACRAANAHDFIEKLPQAYETVLGDRGLNLSGGQRQRITVARAIVRDPGFYIFDEATSSLDSESEQLIQASIENLGNEKTIIIISHRFSTIKNADLIYVMDNGSIVESGTYDELMAKQGFFSTMADQQA